MMASSKNIRNVVEYYGTVSGPAISADDLQTIRQQGVEVGHEGLNGNTGSYRIKVPLEALPLIQEHSAGKFEYAIHPRYVDSNVVARDISSLSLDELPGELAFYEFYVTSPELAAAMPDLSGAPQSIESIKARLFSSQVIPRPQTEGKAMSVPDLQKELSRVEEKFEPLRRKRQYENDEWQAVEREATAIRKQLFELTGDSYGRPKIKIKRPSDDLLYAQYDDPSEIPAEVLSWVSKQGLLTSDATDATRWARIIDTLDDDRYPEGEIVIYRAVEKGGDIVEEIRPGDWVSTERVYAEDHLRRYAGGKGMVLEETVDGLDVLVSPTGNSEEAIYAPREFSGPAITSSNKPTMSAHKNSSDYDSPEI